MKTSNPPKCVMCPFFSDQTLMVGESVGGGLKIEKKSSKDLGSVGG